MLDVSPAAVAAKGFRYGGLVPHGSLNTKENVSLTPFASAWKIPWMQGAPRGPSAPSVRNFGGQGRSRRQTCTGLLAGRKVTVS